MWEKVFNKLKADGFKVYPPTVNRKTSDLPYLVVKIGQQIALNGNVVGQQTLDVIYYEKTYSKCENRAAEIKGSLGELTDLRKTGTETPPIYDREIKAYTGSVEYVIQRRI